MTPKQEPETIRCWDCEGKGGHMAGGFWDGVRDGAEVGGVFQGWMACVRCGGAGRVPEVMRGWADLGGEMRERRVAREESLRAAARRVGVKPSEYADMEAGRVDPSRLL